MAWMQIDSGKHQTTKWGGGAGACKTSLKSQVVIKNPNNVVVPYNLSQGEITWEDVGPDYTIHYRVETGGDEKTGASDEFYFVVSTLNWKYMVEIMNQINAQATEQQKQQWGQDKDSFYQYLDSIVDPSRMMNVIASKVNTSDGNYEGVIRVNRSWMTGPIQMAIIYGYNDDARSSDTSRLWSNIWDTAEWVAFAISMIVLLGLCPWTSGATCATGYAMLAVDIASMAVLTLGVINMGVHSLRVDLSTHIVQ